MKIEPPSLNSGSAFWTVNVLPQVFERADLTPRERLLAAFDVHSPLCPFIAAAVEIPDPGHPARVHARDYKNAFAARLT